VRTVVKGKNIVVPDGVRQYAERKFDRIERLLDDRSEALLELSVEQHRSAAATHIAEVTLVIDGQTLRMHAAGPTHRAAIDTVTDRVERRAVDHKQKPLRARAPERRELLARMAGGTSEDARERRIVKTKRFGIEPMFEEDAVAEMEDLGHSFFIFVNAENERLNVLYRRRDGDYGVIEPVIGGDYTQRDKTAARPAKPRSSVGTRTAQKSPTKPAPTATTSTTASMRP
jgi:putative sigma-54 modulation protein